MNKKKSSIKKQTKYSKSKLIIGVSIGIGLAILLTCFFIMFKNNDVELVSQSQETEETSSKNSINEVTTVSNSQVSNSAVETNRKLTKKAEKILSSMTLEEKVNQMKFYILMYVTFCLNIIQIIQLIIFTLNSIMKKRDKRRNFYVNYKTL